jgi:transposase
MRKIEQIGISAADRERLERLVRDRNTPQKVVWRARIVLLASDGLTAEGIAAAVDKSLLTVRRWRRRYAAKELDGLLKDATLFAALNMLDGKVIATCMPRHRHREFLRFLRLIDRQTPTGLDLHLIVDDYATHKTPAVKRWLKAHPRFHLHFTPTSAIPHHRDRGRRYPNPHACDPKCPCEAGRRKTSRSDGPHRLFGPPAQRRRLPGPRQGRA